MIALPMDDELFSPVSSLLVVISILDSKFELVLFVDIDSATFSDAVMLPSVAFMDDDATLLE